MVCVEGHMLAVLEPTAGQQNRQIPVVVPGGISQVATVEDDRRVEQRLVRFLGLS